MANYSSYDNTPCSRWNSIVCVHSYSVASSNWQIILFTWACWCTVGRVNNFRIQEYSSEDAGRHKVWARTRLKTESWSWTAIRGKQEQTRQEEQKSPERNTRNSKRESTPWNWDLNCFRQARKNKGLRQTQKNMGYGTQYTENKIKRQNQMPI